MRQLNEIIIHCSATRPDWWAGMRTSQKVSEIKRWHVSDRGWKDIGYHFLIDRDGTVAKGRPLEQIGAHVQGRNTGTIGVCLIGGHGSAETDPFAKHYTVAQEKALRKLLADLMKAHPTITRVSGHNQWAAKACPGFNVPSWYAGPRAQAKSGVGIPDAIAKPSHSAPEPVAGFWAELAKLIAAIFRGRT